MTEHRQQDSLLDAIMSITLLVGGSGSHSKSPEKTLPLLLLLHLFENTEERLTDFES